MTPIYYAASCAAIALSVVLTGYSALTSWSLAHDPVGPIAAVSASIGLMLAVFTFTHHRQWSIRCIGVVIGVVGMTAAVISGAMVKQRVATSIASQVQTIKDVNVPRRQAELALANAETELKTAAADAKAECRRVKNKTACASAEKRETDARNRVAEARTKVSSAGAHASEEHAAPEVAALLPIALPVWVELAAPVFAALGIAIWPQGVSPAVTSLARKPLAASEENPERKPTRKRSQGARRKPTRARYGTAAYWLSRLDDARPDLARLVRAGELSANGAAIQAGYRKSPVRLVSSQ